MCKTNLHSNVEVVTILTLCTNFQVFALFALQSSPMKLYFWYLSCTHFPEITHQYILFDPLFHHLKHFETSAILCVIKRILLVIGRNLRYSPVLQISHFPDSLKNLSPVWNYFRWRILHFHSTRHRKRIIFVFCNTFKVLLVQQKSNKGTLPNTKWFFYCKTRVLCKIAMFIASQYFFSDNCWKSSHNIWTLPHHDSRSLQDLGFPACYSTSAQSPTAPFWKTNVLGKLQENVPFKMTDKSLRVKLVIASLLEHNLNQRISHFRSFTATC